MKKIFGKNKISSEAPSRAKRPTEKKEESGSHIVRIKTGVDKPFLIIVLILVSIGTIMVFSSSYAYAKANNGDSYFFSKKQIIWALVAVAAMIGLSNFDYMFFKKWNRAIYVISIILLILVPIIGFASKGAKRWIDLGFTTFQPSELVKAAIVFMFANYAAKNQDKFYCVKYGVGYYAIFAIIPCVFLYLQPHLSCCIIVLFLTAIMMYAGGTRLKHIITSAVAAASVGVPAILLTSHGASRISVWLDPASDITGKGWQPLQSLYAIGSGGFWGVGLGQSRQKHLWLPEPQNDYIFSILCEEMGFVFAVAVLLLFMALVWRGFYIAKHAPSRFASLVVIGLVSQVAIQVILNIAVVTNSVPSTGISLPFFSYGGTSLLVVMAEMGIVLNISRYSYIEKT